MKFRPTQRQNGATGAKRNGAHRRRFRGASCYGSVARTPITPEDRMA
ncbi:MAG: hypothetical protein SFU56_03005 [Capsulimonadales bacterium]|nr:hypothetical protein [Capsulimonadales bacterium]